MSSTNSKPLRRPEWRQPTPADQLVALINAARGIADNIADGTTAEPDRVKKDAARIDELLAEVLEVSRLPPGKWD